MGDATMRYLPWAIGAIVTLVYFSVFETLAFLYPERFATLSNTVATLGHVWPFAIFLMGFFCGGLAVHFFWPWKKSPFRDSGG